MNDFNPVARYYDLLARLMFGRKLFEMRAVHLSSVKPGMSILVLGGGTGSCLELLPQSCEVVYVEKSKVMIARARRRAYSCTVRFVNDDFLTWVSSGQYDVILAPFFLDVFSAGHLPKVLEKMRALLTARGWWIVTDFQHTSKVWHRLLLGAMHLFFRWTSGLESRSLADIQANIEQNEMKLQRIVFSPKGFIFSAVYH